MRQEISKRIGLIVGEERDWPDAFMKAVNESNSGIVAEMVKLAGTPIDSPCAYSLIIDRMSHDVPYYRAYLKYAALQGCQIINDPFTRSADDKFFGLVMSNSLGLSSPRTIVLPNKEIAKDLGPDSFRNLEYPMDWQGIVDYVGVPAIFKDVHSGGRLAAYRVHSVDELVKRYDESGTRTMILQQIIESESHVHCFVIAREKVMSLSYSLAEGKYLPDAIGSEGVLAGQMAEDALNITRAFGYDINMVEFVVEDERPFIINSTNPAPLIDLDLMSEEQFNWCVSEIAAMAIGRLTGDEGVAGSFSFPIT
jgi:hypothetical protein